MSYHGDPAAEGIAAARADDRERLDLIDRIKQPDYGDSFTTGEEIVAMLQAGDLDGALARMQRSIELHRRCGNMRKASYIKELQSALRKGVARRLFGV